MTDLKTQNAGGEHALVLISFPHQLLHALAAMHADRTSRGIPQTAPATIFVWSHRAYQHRDNSQTLVLLRKLIAAFPYVELLTPSTAERLFRFSPYRRIASRSRSLSVKFRSIECTSVYYSHDVSYDHTAQAVMQALPDAWHVCFGDPPGFIYPTFPDATAAAAGILQTWKAPLWRSRLVGLHRWLGPNAVHVAVNLQATDPQASLEAPIQIVSRTVLLDTIAAMKNGLPEVTRLEQACLDCLSAGQNAALLAISNFTESGLTTRSNEVALYQAICKEHLKPGDVIFIKRHFGSHSDLVPLLQAALSEFKIQVLPDELQVVPLEMLSTMIRGVSVFSVSSASALLAALYGNATVKHVLTDALIEQYFISNYVDYMRSSTDAIHAVMTARPSNA